MRNKHLRAPSSVNTTSGEVALHLVTQLSLVITEASFHSERVGIKYGFHIFFCSSAPGLFSLGSQCFTICLFISFSVFRPFLLFAYVYLLPLFFFILFISLLIFPRLSLIFDGVLSLFFTSTFLPSFRFFLCHSYFSDF